MKIAARILRSIRDGMDRIDECGGNHVAVNKWTDLVYGESNEKEEDDGVE